MRRSRKDRRRRERGRGKVRRTIRVEEGGKERRARERRRGEGRGAKGRAKKRGDIRSGEKKWTGMEERTE